MVISLIFYSLYWFLQQLLLVLVIDFLQDLTDNICNGLEPRFLQSIRFIKKNLTSWYWHWSSCRRFPIASIRHSGECWYLFCIDYFFCFSNTAKNIKDTDWFILSKTQYQFVKFFFYVMPRFLPLGKNILMCHSVALRYIKMMVGIEKKWTHLLGHRQRHYKLNSNRLIS